MVRKRTPVGLYQLRQMIPETIRTFLPAVFVGAVDSPASGSRIEEQDDRPFNRLIKAADFAVKRKHGTTS